MAAPLEPRGRHQRRPDWGAPAYGAWRISARELLNPGSAGAPVYRIALAPADGKLVPWQAGENDTLALRVRQHRRFQVGDNMDRPMILIGNGTGIAGLRAHLKERIAAGQSRTWLVFGERNAAHDHFCRADIEAWQQQAEIESFSLAFSRDGGELRYVLHALAAPADQLRDWIAQGAAVYVCGSLQGMASGVHDALAQAIGHEQLDDLYAAGRYRRDVY